MVSRERLFRLLDEGRMKPVTWVSAPAGSGKTALVASWLEYGRPAGSPLRNIWYQVDEGDGDMATFFYYMGLAAKKAAPRYKKDLPLLTPEYLQGILTFTRRYFETLFSRLIPPNPALPKSGKKGGFTVVLDNYQDAPLQSGFNEMIASALEVIPEGVNVIVISRAGPPAELSRLTANFKINLLGWDDIRFTPEESSELVNAHGEKLTEDAQQALYEKTEGWAAGLVLMSESARSGGFANRPYPNTQHEVFDYFACEIFNKSDPALQDVLLKTAFLPKIESTLAERVTGIQSAGQILETLSRRNYFTQRYLQGYQYHPLFREFLLMRARSTFSQADLAHIQRTAAELLMESGQIEDSALLFRNAGDWEGLSKLILSQARTLVSQGRSKTLEEWISSIPKEIADVSPWLLYWFGVSRLAYNPPEAREYFEKAYTLFKKDQYLSGLLLAWASIVDTFAYEWSDFKPLDHWIFIIEQLMADNPEFPSPEIEARVACGMLNALMWRQPDNSALPMWAERVRQIVLSHIDINMRIGLGNHLVIYYLWYGYFPKAGTLIDTLRPLSRRKDNDPLTQQTWFVMEAMYSWFAADGKTCMEAVTKGLKNAEENGVHLLDQYLLAQGVYSGLTLEDPSAAYSCLEKMSHINSPRLMDKSLYHYQASSVDWHRGDLKRAIVHGEDAVKLAGETGSPLPHALCLIELALTHFDNEDHEEATLRINEACHVGRKMNGIEYLCLIYKAWFAFADGKEMDGQTLLRQGLALGAKQGYVNFPRWSGKTMSILSGKALKYRIETEYVNMLIRRRNLSPPGSHTSSTSDAEGAEKWPYSIKIYTIGRFEILIDDKPVAFSRKLPKKPLAMLQAIIAAGGAASDAHLSDILWPEADGDLAHESLVVNIKRLRRLLGHKDALLLKRGSVSINPGICWVDALAKKPMQECRTINL